MWCTGAVACLLCTNVFVFVDVAGRASFEATRAHLASLAASRKASEVVIPESTLEDMRRMR